MEVLVSRVRETYKVNQIVYSCLYWVLCERLDEFYVMQSLFHQKQARRWRNQNNQFGNIVFQRVNA